MTFEPLGLSECGRCGRTIRWAISAKSEKPMPFDAVPSAGGTFAFSASAKLGEHRPVASFVTPRLRSGDLWVAHAGTCPMAEKYKLPPVAGNTRAETQLAWMEQTVALTEAERLADELIDLTRKKVGHFPIYLECREEWDAFRAAHDKVDKRVLKLVSAAALRKLHPDAAAIGDQAEANRARQGARA